MRNILSLEAPGFLQSAVSWLPLTHDMGLVMGVFLPLFDGISTVLLSPMDFLRRPLVWLELISEMPDAISGGLNFAYELCCRIREEQLQTLNLKRWKAVAAGSEMNQIKIYRESLKKFSAYGFHENASATSQGERSDGELVICARRRFFIRVQ